VTQIATVERPRSIPTLDGWRAVAILLVIWAHASMGLHPSYPEYSANSLARFGVIGVPIFFGISGLLICKLLLEEEASSGTISLRAFYLRRCFRILPPLFTFLLAAVVLGCIVRPWELASSVFFFRNYYPDLPDSGFSSHLWSLSVEEHFYLFWPGLLCILLRIGRPFLSTACLALGFGLWRAVDMHVHLTARLFPLLDTTGRSDYRLDGLLWGCAAAFMLQRPEVREFLKKRLGGGAFTLSLLFYLVCLIRPVHLTGIWMAMLIPWLILGTITHKRWLLSRILNLAPLRWIGRISYSLYLWQQLFLVPTWELHVLPYVQRPFLNLAMCFLCATVSYYLIERPMIRLGRRLEARMRESSQVVPHAKALAEVSAREP